MHLSANLRTKCSVTATTELWNSSRFIFVCFAFFCILRSHSWINNNKCDGWWLALWFDYVYRNARKMFIWSFVQIPPLPQQKEREFFQTQINSERMCGAIAFIAQTNEATSREKNTVKNTSFIHLHERERFNWICRVFILIILLLNVLRVLSHLLSWIHQT